MSETTYAFDWANLAFGNKRPLKELHAIFIAAPRELSEIRFKQLVKEYLPQGDIVLGVSKEPYVAGFEEQPQFRMLELGKVQKIIDQVNASKSPHKLYTLEYFQRELPHILEKLNFKHVVLVNGSWRHVFHVSPAYYVLTGAHIPYDMVSPFASEDEAHEYETRTDAEIIAKLGPIDRRSDFTEAQLLDIATKSATRSYDYSFQTGLSLARRVNGSKDKYKLLISTFNVVVPFQTYAMHHGALRERHFSPANDLNYYDTVHAEAQMIVQAVNSKDNPNADFRGTTLFINLLPCPACARMLSQTDIEEFVYSIDHSDGYAIKMLQAAGKKVRRVVL